MRIKTFFFINRHYKRWILVTPSLEIGLMVKKEYIPFEIVIAWLSWEFRISIYPIRRMRNG